MVVCRGAHRIEVRTEQLEVTGRRPHALPVPSYFGMRPSGASAPSLTEEDAARESVRPFSRNAAITRLHAPDSSAAEDRLHGWSDNWSAWSRLAE